MAEMTVADLIAKLERMNPEAKVRGAVQPKWPFEHRIQEVVETSDGTCWIAIGDQVDYLPGEAQTALGWNE